MTQQSLIVAATQRSGSTLFCRDLELTGVVGTPREWLQHTALEERIRAYGLRPDVAYTRLVREIVERESGVHGVFSMKIMWDILEAFFYILRRDEPEGSVTDRVRILKDFFPNPRFIYVSRSDKIRQAVSYIKSLQSGNWVSQQGKNPYRAELLRFDYPDIRAALTKFENEDRFWRNFFEVNKLPFFEVIYEDFIKDREATVKKALEYLRLPCDLPPRPESNEITPMTDDINKQWLTAFLEIYQAREDGRNLLTNGDALETDARCVPQKSVDVMNAGERFLQRVLITNTGKTTLANIGHRDGRGWIQVRARWIREAHPMGTIDSGRGFLPRALLPGEGASCELTLSAPETPGSYRLEVDLWQDGVGWLTQNTGATDIEARTIHMHVRLNQAEQLTRDLFPDAAPCLEGWKWVPWFGYVNTARAPWLFHAELGWMLVGLEGSVGGDFWFYLEPLGWTKTSVSEFPCIWIQKEDGWFRYAGRTDGTCRFENLVDGAHLDVSPVF